MAGEMPKLLGWWPSPFLVRPRVLLNLKGIENELVLEEFGTKSELFLASNPVYKKIPILLHRGKAINESLIILQYIDESFPSSPSILPSDPYRRSQARFWAYVVDDKLIPGIIGIAKAHTEEAKEAAVKQVLEVLQLLEDEAFPKCSEGGSFFGGEGIGYLDIAIGAHLGWLRGVAAASGIDLLGATRFPRIAAWAERFLGHDAVKGVIPETQRMVELIGTLRATRWDPAPPPAAS